MGGFFLIHKTREKDRSAQLTEMHRSFCALGFPPPETIETQDYVLVAYPSIENRSIVLTRYPNGDFVYVCGTCLCECGVGVAAANLVYKGKIAAIREPRFMGHYAIVIRRGHQTEIKLDQFGGYHLFYNSESGIVSTSFYAMCMALQTLTLSPQSACEYVFNGVVSGNHTLFTEIAVAPIGATISVGGQGLNVTRPKLRITCKFTSESRIASIDQSMALLDRYFGAVKKSFGDRVSCALSGGYDSRLILACLRRHGIRPRVYVYGPDGERDVSIAGYIAHNEGFELAVIDKADRPIVPPQEFAAVAHLNFLAQDGYGWGGIFQNAAEIAESGRRVHGNTIAFNGGGGEIFRNFFYLLDREYSIDEILWSFYSQFDPAMCTKIVDIKGYYDALADKIVDLIGCGERRLPRPTVEWLYHSFRCRSWDGKVESICGRYGHTAMPYLEPSITEQASALPLSWKNHGAYEAELIRCADRRLAGYPSAYGHAFAGPPPFSRRLADYATYFRPPWLRRYTYRLRHLHRRGNDWPGYLAEPYRRAVLPGEPEFMRRLFRLDRIADEEQFTRVLSLEYALRQFGSRVRPQF